MMKPGVGVERVYEHEGCVFVIRDIWREDQSKASGVSLERCEYKTKKDGGIRWVPCREGVSFSEIEPYDYKMPPRNWVV
jgi:hypothetical protein